MMCWQHISSKYHGHCECIIHTNERLVKACGGERPVLTNKASVALDGISGRFPELDKICPFDFIPEELQKLLLGSIGDHGIEN